MRRSAIAASVSLVVGLSACSLALDVDGYEPSRPGSARDFCKPLPAGACEERGERYVFIATAAGIGRVIPTEGRSDIAEGIDLDGTTDVVCGEFDYTSPFDEAGVDNQLAPYVDFLEEALGMSFREASQMATLQGEGLLLIEVEGVGDLVDDPCVSFAFRDGRLPEGTDLADLDREPPMGVLDSGLTFDYSGIRQSDEFACIEDGVVRVRLLDSRRALSIGDLISPREVTVERARVMLRFRIDADGAVTGFDGVQGVSSPGDELDDAFRDLISVPFTDLISPDLDPDSSNICQSVSFGFTTEGVRASLGELYR